MRYLLTKDFIKISETSGTIQNVSDRNIVEVSNQAVAGSGLLLFPKKFFSFSYSDLFVRCVAGGGGAEIRVVPFATNTAGGNQSIGEYSEESDDAFIDDMTHLFD